MDKFPEIIAHRTTISIRQHTSRCMFGKNVLITRAVDGTIRDQYASIIRILDVEDIVAFQNGHDVIERLHNSCVVEFIADIPRANNRWHFYYE